MNTSNFSYFNIMLQDLKENSLNKINKINILINFMINNIFQCKEINYINKITYI